MKPRKVLVTLTMRTEIPLQELNDRYEWQRAVDNHFSYEKVPSDIEKVDAVRLK